ncbi:unnamed protein product [Linum trigynum]|uniref:KIB1-4 beta-propeller domain-containing protein n=1 Tax=Linum trigynum TaxID=586398 RepID=A0AAV2GB40_9ROSI
MISSPSLHSSVIPTTPPPPPSISLPLFPSPSKMSDAHGQRDRYLLLHQEFITTFPGEAEQSSPYNVEASSLASKDGWILRELPFHGDSRGRHLDLYLLNPFTGASIPLPLLKSESSSFDLKAIISSSPDGDQDCHVFTLSGLRKKLLAWCKVGPGGGGGGWTYPPKNCLVCVRDYTPLDACYSNGNLYLAGEDALWVVHDILKPFSAAAGPIVKAFPYSGHMKSFDAQNGCAPVSGTHPYLCHLDGGGQVRVILPDCKGDYYVGFRVFKLVDEGKGLDRVLDYFPSGNVDRGEYWEEVWSLDGHAVFIGTHQSFAFPTKVDAIASQATSILNPNASGIRGDYIYSALNRVCGHLESFGAPDWDGAFDLANRKFQRFAHDELYGDNKTRDAIFWFIPVPWANTKSTASENQQRRRKKGKKKKKQITGVPTASQEAETST